MRNRKGLVDHHTGVLVIATGGNICLTTVKAKGTEKLAQASLDDIRRLVLGEPDADGLRLREASVEGEELRLRFYDLRPPSAAMGDPEEQDSAQVKPELWSKIAVLINQEYRNYEGFVVLHGLDTMAYTASALSFMLGDLAKPVVVTGSQRPLSYRRTDAVQNTISAITCAGAHTLGIEPVVPEVTIYSHDSLFRGNRASMVSASSYRSFETLNCPTLAVMGSTVDIQSHLLLDHRIGKRLNLRKDATAKVHIIDVFPGMDPRILRTILESNRELIERQGENRGAARGSKEAANKTDATNKTDVTSKTDIAAVGEMGLWNDTELTRGVLLRTYGLGTAPTRRGFLEAIEELVESGVVIVNVTQARSGRITYSPDPLSLRLFEKGVVSGVDMTAEAAYAKMVTLLSRESNSRVVADRMQIEMCAEQSQSIFTVHFGPGETVKDEELPKPTALLERMHEVTQRDLLDRGSRIHNIQLRVFGITPEPKPKQPFSRIIEFDAYVVDREHEKPKIVADLKREHTLAWNDRGRMPTINVSFDITSSRDQLLSAGSMLRFDSNEAIRWKHASVVVYAEIRHMLSS